MDMDGAFVCALAGMAVGALLTAVCMARGVLWKLKFLIDALEDNETNVRFRERGSLYGPMNHLLNRLRGIYERKQNEILLREAYYMRLLDVVKTGVLVIDHSPVFDGRIIYSNAAALSLLGISGISHMRQLRLIGQELERDFTQCPDNGERHTCFYNESGKVSLSLSAIETKLSGKDVRVVVFNDITSVMEDNENLSWNKLIRVLTHEIMNMVTPISSLSQSLQAEVAHHAPLGEKERQVLAHGLDAIGAAADGMVHFVKSYRSLTRLASPVKKAISVGELMEKVMTLTHEHLTEHGAEMTYRELADDILLYADESQLSQVLVNMVKNAVQARAKHIHVTACINGADAVEIRVTNDGLPISKENRDEIFVPFYTTKADGSGIGLSLSRQIMRMHNGTLILEKSNEKETSFLLVFK